MEEDYEIMPHKELKHLKEEIKKLKDKDNKKTPKFNSETIETLTDSINGLMTVLKEASKEVRTEESEAIEAYKKITDMADKLDVIMEQNEKIAEGIVSLAEIIQEKYEEEDQPEPVHEVKQEPTPSLNLGNPMGGMPNQPVFSQNPSPVNPSIPAQPNQFSQNPSSVNPSMQNLSPNLGMSNQQEPSLPPPNFQNTPSMPPPDLNSPSMAAPPLPGMGTPPPPSIGAPPSLDMSAPPLPGSSMQRNGSPFDMGGLDNMPPPPAPPGKFDLSASPLGGDHSDKKEHKGLFSKFK